MIEHKIPHFLYGVSRQAENKKQPGTMNEMLNTYCNLSEGAEKRRGLQFQRILSTLTNPAEDYKIHFITTTDKSFVVFFTSHTSQAAVASRLPIQIFDLDTGLQQTLTLDGGGSYDTNYKTYLTRNDGDTGDIDPNVNLKVFSIFDSTFIVNTDKTCALTGTADGSTASLPSNAAYGSKGDGTYGLGFDMAPVNENTYPSHSDFPMRFNSAIGQVVNGNPPGSGEYYKSLESSVGYPAGVYLAGSSGLAADEALYTLQITDYDNSLIDYTTMPLQLVYEGGVNFTLKYPSWSHRKTGNDDTNPGPSFIGRKIDDMVFHKNRLWISADEFLVSSQAGDFFNFWPTDPTAQVPSDPIDESIADDGLNKILYSVPFSQTLVLFTEGGRQFEVRSLGSMAPDTVTIIPTTSYYTNPNLRPLFLGNTLYFMSSFENYGQIYEYYYIDNAASNVASSVTDHIPDYLPTDFSVRSRDINNGIMLFSADSGTTVYPYISRWQGEDKIINAFSKWQFASTGYEIKSHYYDGGKFWFVMKDANNSWILCTLDTVNRDKIGNIPYNESLDFYEIFASGGSYDSGTNRTTFTMSIDISHPDSVDSADTDTNIDFDERGDYLVHEDLNIDNYRVIVSDGGVDRADYEGFALPILEVSSDGTNTSVTVAGDWTGHTVVIGLVYPWQCDMNLIYFKDENGTTVNGSFSMKKFVLFVKDTVRYSVDLVTPGRSENFSYTYQVVRLGADNTSWDNIPALDTVRTQNNIYGKGETSRIVLKDTSEYPITLVEGEIRGVFSKALRNK